MTNIAAQQRDPQEVMSMIHAQKKEYCYFKVSCVASSHS